MQMFISIIGFMLPALLLLSAIGVIVGTVEALIKTWNSSDTSFAMLRLRRYAISASVAIVGFFLSIIYVEGFGGPDSFFAVTTTLALLTLPILSVMFFWLMGDALGNKKRFRWVYLLSTVSIVVLVIFWTWIGYQQTPSYGYATIVSTPVE